MNYTNQTAPAIQPNTRRPRTMAREPQPMSEVQVNAPAPTKRASKTDLVLGLLRRPEGATIDQLVAATGWLSHTTRAALTGLREKGHAVASEKVEDQRRYRIVCRAD